MPSTAEVVHALAAPVGDLGGRWMLDREVLGPSRSFGYPSRYAYYLAGRGGVLGDVDAHVVHAALGFFEPTLVRKMWEAGVAVEGARASAARYGAACAQWGRARLGGFVPAERLADLNRHVIDSVDPIGMPLFAGWRAEPRPDDSAGLAYFTTHLMRELRGGAHIAAVVCSGIAPREAILTSEGEGTAQQFGWTAPFPDVSHLVELRAETEAMTDRTMTRFFDEALNADQSTELLELVLAMKAHLDHAQQQTG
ncbi:MAG: hypothetical protein ABI894_04870 [Ilumatobacteraceae bacterium]